MTTWREEGECLGVRNVQGPVSEKLPVFMAFPNLPQISEEVLRDWSGVFFFFFFNFY